MISLVLHGGTFRITNGLIEHIIIIFQLFGFIENYLDMRNFL